MPRAEAQPSLQGTPAARLEPHWVCGIVEKVTCRATHLELQISVPGNGSRRVFVDHAMLDRYGFADASSLTERVVFLTQPGEQGWVNLLPVERRVDYAQASAAAGWLHPSYALADDRACPCGLGESYAMCHGGRIASRAPSEMP